MRWRWQATAGRTERAATLYQKKWGHLIFVMEIGE